MLHNDTEFFTHLHHVQFFAIWTRDLWHVFVDWERVI